jgi:hypothetical protein
MGRTESMKRTLAFVERGKMRTRRLHRRWPPLDVRLYAFPPGIQPKTEHPSVNALHACLCPLELRDFSSNSLSRKPEYGVSNRLTASQRRARRRRRARLTSFNRKHLRARTGCCAGKEPVRARRCSRLTAHAAAVLKAVKNDWLRPPFLLPAILSLSSLLSLRFRLHMYLYGLILMPV